MGIRNKAIIISACHSGRFVPHLKDDHTLIMTSAHADRLSHPNAANWNYFSHAQFNHAIRETSSLPAAFEKARAQTSKWEADSGLKLSEPQFQAGNQIIEKLDALLAPHNHVYVGNDPF